MHNHHDKFTWSLIVIVVLIIGFNVYLHNNLLTTQNQLNNNFKELNSKLDDISENLDSFRTDQNSVNENLSASIDQNQKEIKFNFDTYNDDFKTLKNQVEYYNQQSIRKIDELQQETGEIKGSVETLSGTVTSLKNSASSDFTDVIDETVPATVAISSSAGIGSGAAINDNYLITNYHVINGGSGPVSSIRIRTHDDDYFGANVVAYSPFLDLAILETEENIDEVFKFGDVDDIVLGQKVMAIGSPRGLTFTVTEGIVSQKNRAIDSTNIPYIQTSVAINPGNSGGPLIDTDGRLLGVNTLKISESEGLGFAIPISTIEDFIDEVENELDIQIK